MPGKLVVEPHWVNESAPLKRSDETLVLEFIAPGLHDVMQRKKRSPMDIVVVLDISGSMAWDNKIVTLKLGMTKIINDWLQDTDRLSIVTFAGEAQVQLKLKEGSMNSTGKKIALKKVDMLEANGSTNMEEGLKFALNELQQREWLDREIRRPAAIIFMSDGLQMIGDYTRILPAIKDAHIHVDTIGYGKGQAAEALDMIAGTCGGVYNNVWDPNYLTSACSSLVYFISHTVVLNLKLKIQEHSCSIKSIQFGSKPLPLNGDDIVIGSIGACANRKLTVKLTLDEARDEIYDSSVLTVSWKYWGGEPGHFGYNNDSERTITIHRLRATNRVRSLPVIPIQARTEGIRLKHVDAIEAVKNLANERKMDQAQQKLVETRDMLASEGTSELEEYIGHLYDEVEYLFSAVESYDIYDKEGGRACFLATLSSHNCQRHTMKGEGSENLRLYVRTERLHRYLNEAIRFDRACI